MKKYLLAMSFLVFVLPAYAQDTGGNRKVSQTVTGLDAVALNGAAATRTFVISTDSDQNSNTGSTANGYMAIHFWVDFTHANNGTLTLTCTVGPSSADNDYTPTTCTVASGTCTLNFGGVIVTPSLSADKKYEASMLILGNRDVSCVMAHGGTPAAGDIVTVKYSLY